MLCLGHTLGVFLPVWPTHTPPFPTFPTTHHHHPCLRIAHTSSCQPNTQQTWQNMCVYYSIPTSTHLRITPLLTLPPLPHLHLPFKNRIGGEPLGTNLGV